jgi:hypothetical protein
MDYESEESKTGKICYNCGVVLNMGNRRTWVVKDRSVCSDCFRKILFEDSGG